MTSSITINQNIDVLAKQCKADTDHDFGLSSDEKTIFTNNTYNFINYVLIVLSN